MLVSIHFKWSFISKSSSLKKFHAQCCLKYFVTNSAWDKIEPLRLQQKKKFSKLTYYSHIHYGYHAYIQWYVLKKEIKIFFWFQTFQIPLCFVVLFFCVVEWRWSFFFCFWLVLEFFSSVGMKPMNKEQLLHHLPYYSWTGSIEADLCGTTKTFFIILVKLFVPHRNFLSFCHILQNYSI